MFRFIFKSISTIISGYISRPSTNNLKFEVTDPPEVGTIDICYPIDLDIRPRQGSTYTNDKVNITVSNHLPCC